MTSTDERRDTDPLITATAGDAERGVRRELLKHGFTSDGPDLIDPELIAAIMTVVAPVLEAKNDEIRRQRIVIGSAGAAAEKAVGERLAVLEASARASERVRCAEYLNSNGFTEAASLLRSWAAARSVVNAGLRGQAT